MDRAKKYVLNRNGLWRFRRRNPRNTADKSPEYYLVFSVSVHEEFISERRLQGVPSQYKSRTQIRAERGGAESSAQSRRCLIKVSAACTWLTRRYVCHLCKIYRPHQRLNHFHIYANGKLNTTNTPDPNKQFPFHNPFL